MDSTSFTGSRVFVIFLVLACSTSQLILEPRKCPFTRVSTESELMNSSHRTNIDSGFGQQRASFDNSVSSSILSKTRIVFFFGFRTCRRRRRRIFFFLTHLLLVESLRRRWRGEDENVFNTKEEEIKLKSLSDKKKTRQTEPRNFSRKT